MAVQISSGAVTDTLLPLRSPPPLCAGEAHSAGTAHAQALLGPPCVPLQGRAEEEDAGWGAQEPGPFLPAFLLQTEGLGRTARERPAQAGG